MIQELHLSNFQSHKETILSLHEGVNVITGSSDSGKSALIRAINWVAKNRPSGSAYRSIWGGETSCLLVTDKGRITHFRDDSQIGYVVDGEPLVATGAEPPEEVLNALQFDSDLTIQYQHDAPFGLSFTSGEVAKLLNRLVKLDDIDVVLSRLDSLKRDNSKRIKALNEFLEDKNKELEKLSFLKEAEHSIQQIELMTEQLEEKRNKEENMEELLHSFTLLYEKWESFPDATQAEKDILSFEKELKKADETHTRYTALVELSKEIKEEQSFLKEISVLCKAEKDIQTLIDDFGIFKEQAEIYQEGVFLLDEITSLEVKVKDLEESLKEQEEQLHAETPDRCPLCGNIIQGVLQ